MKKALSMILTLAVLLTCCIVGVSAKEKIADSLQAEMDAAGENETIRVIIWLYDPVDKEEVFRQAIKECGYVGGLPLNMTQEEVNAYHTVYNRIVFEQEAAAVNSFIEKFGLDAACINETYCLCINANLTKAQIEAAAAYSEVEGIYFDNEGSPVEPIEDNIDHPVQNELYKARLKEYYNLSDWDGVTHTNGLMNYKELYYHKDKKGNTDWVLVYAVTNMQSPMALNTLVGNRVIMGSSCAFPFDTGYGIYDVQNDTFVKASTSAASSYDGFERTFDEIGTGRLLGDIDRDNEISVLDVTIMQRCLADMREFPADDEIKTNGGSLWMYSAKYYSDFDRDGERDLLDATCIQRYLAGLPYSIG